MATTLRSAVALFVCGLAIASAALAQEPGDLVAAARKAREKKSARAKVSLNDDNLKPALTAKSEFADLDLADPKSARVILKSVEEFKAGHTPEETEAAVRAWFEQNRDKIETLLSEVKTLTDNERTKSTESGEPPPEVVKQSDALQQQLRHLLEALKANDGNTNEVH